MRRTNLDPRHVPETRHLSGGIAFDDDVAEFLFRGQTPLDIQRQLHRNPFRVRVGADGTGGHLNVLFTHGPDHLACSQVEGGDFFGIQPQAHGVIAGAKAFHPPDTRQPRQLIAHIQNGIVAQIQIVIAPLWRDKVHNHRQIRRTFDRRHPQLPGDVGQARQGL